MTHPLTDKDIQRIWDKIAAHHGLLRIVDAEDEDLFWFVEDALIRAAYDLGANQQLEQVLDWLNNNVGMLILSTESELATPYLELLEEEFIQDFRKAMHPQEES